MAAQHASPGHRCSSTIASTATSTPRAHEPPHHLPHWRSRALSCARELRRRATGCGRLRPECTAPGSSSAAAPTSSSPTRVRRRRPSRSAATSAPCASTTTAFIVGAGASLSAVVQEAFKRAIGGFEFAVGVAPGTVGGALRMNAGTADEWIGQRVVSVTTYRPGRGLARRRGDEIAWGYRASSFAADEVVLECELAAEAADPYRVRDKMEGNLARRKGCQPLSEPTCGSVFKNPEGRSAGRLDRGGGIEGCRGGRCESVRAARQLHSEPRWRHGRRRARAHGTGARRRA